MSGCQNGSESEGLSFNLCVALPHIVVSLISEDKVGSDIGYRRLEMTLLLRQKSDKDDEEEVPSHRTRRGFKRIMLRENYVKDKSIFELRKHTRVVLLI